MGDSMKTNSFQQTIILFALLQLLISGCGAAPLDGEAVNLFYGTSQWIIDGCIYGECGSQIFYNAQTQLVVYARPFLDGVAFVVEKNGAVVKDPQGFSGNLVNLRTWHGFRDWLIASGFAQVVDSAVYRAYMVSLTARELVPIFAIGVSPGFVPDVLDKVIPAAEEIDV
jgi:hypothetical protein